MSPLEFIHRLAGAGAVNGAVRYRLTGQPTVASGRFWPNAASPPRPPWRACGSSIGPASPDGSLTIGAADLPTRRPQTLQLLGGHTRPVNIIDEMLSLDLLSAEQHRDIAAWVRRARTPEAILAMPPHLWRALESASVVMNIDADLSRPPWLGADLA